MCGCSPSWGTLGTHESEQLVTGRAFTEQKLTSDWQDRQCGWRCKCSCDLAGTGGLLLQAAIPQPVPSLAAASQPALGPPTPVTRATRPPACTRSRGPWRRCCC